MSHFGDKVNFLWSVADLLRGTYKQADYGKVILPMTVLRRLDCALAATKEKVLAQLDRLQGGPVKNLDPLLERVTGYRFHNTSRLDFPRLKGDPSHIAANLTTYINSFSERARQILDHFNFTEQIGRLDRANLLYLVVEKFCTIDLHPAAVSNHEMGTIFEELIRKFAELSNETAGEHFTPREVIRLMVNLLFQPDGNLLANRSLILALQFTSSGRIPHGYKSSGTRAVRVRR